MKKISIFCALLIMTISAFSQNVGIGTATPAEQLSVGANSQFQVDANGNAVRINDVPYSFPAAHGTTGTQLQNDGAGNLSWAAPGIKAWVLQDEKSPGANGGNAIAGNWVTPTLNTVAVSGGTEVILSGNVMVIQPGKYLIQASAPAYNVGGFRLRSYNGGAGIVVATGTSEISTPGSNVQTRSFVNTIITPASTSFYSLQQYVVNPGSTGLGLAVGIPGATEVYTTVTITKIQ